MADFTQEEISLVNRYCTSLDAQISNTNQGIEINDSMKTLKLVKILSKKESQVEKEEDRYTYQLKMGDNVCTPQVSYKNLEDLFPFLQNNFN